MTGQYKLDAAGNPVRADDLLEWGRWLETAERHVGKNKIGSVLVSTVFLGLDHSFGSGPPVLWETMVFGGPLDQSQERYTSKEEALEGHAKWVAAVKQAAVAREVDLNESI